MNSGYMNSSYMNLALELASKAKGQTAPNPMVGCVIVDECNNIISTGYHKKAGLKHAELDAFDNYLNNKSDNIDYANKLEGLKKSTVYINLEPCCHYGKTPPCVDLLIKYQVNKVCIAMLDPNPIVSGRSIKKLKQANITVEIGISEKQAQELNHGFISRVTKNRPYITSKIAASLDGNIALANGQSKWITSPKSRLDVMYQRAYSDAIVTTASTVIADNCSLTVRDINIDLDLKDYIELKQPIRVVLDKNLDTNLDYKIYKNQDISKTILITSTISSTVINNSENIKKLKKIADFEQNNIAVKYFNLDINNKFNIADIWRYLAELGCNNVFIEAGSNFNGYLLSNNSNNIDKNKLVDRWLVYQSGLVMGPMAKSMFNIAQQSSMSELFKLKCKQIKQIDQDWCLILEN